MKKIKIIIAAHKKYKMPKEKIYIPLQVGSKGKENIGFRRDDTGDNISEKNPYFCELTGIYWAWKNLDADYIGLAHYRRHFTIKKCVTPNIDKKFENILKEKELLDILKETDVVLPQKRKYYIETLYSHYEHTLYIEPLNEARKIIEEKYPEYLNEFDKLHKRRSAHMFNMFIMKKEIFNNYCTWIFDILFELEKRVDVKQYNAFHARFFGRVSELLLDVWINQNNIKYKEIRVINTENVNWLKKGSAFLEAKFIGKKYKESF